MRQAALLLAAGLLALVVAVAQAADPSATISWVYAGPAEPSKNPDGLQTRDYRVLSGLQFWKNRADDDRKQSTLEAIPAPGSPPDFDAAYADLCLRGRKLLVGPSSYLETVNVIMGSNATSVCGADVLWAFLWMDDDLALKATTLGLNWFSLHPRLPLDDPLDVYVVRRLLLDQDHYTWSILTEESSGSDPELDRVAAYGAALANALVTPSVKTENLQFTLFQNESFAAANASELVPDFVFQMARRRPEVNVFALAVTSDDAAFINFVKQTLYPALNLEGAPPTIPKEANPDVMLLLAPVEYYDFTKADRKYLKYWTALAMWDHSFTWKHDKTKSWSMGSPQQYYDDFDDDFGRRPGNWDALATISAVVLDRANAKGGLSNVKLNTFWGPIDFTGNSTRQAPADKWHAVQFLHGHTSAIGPKKAFSKSVDSPGRWKWKSYSLTSDAIAAIVLGVLLMLLGLAVAVIAAYKFIGLWLHPPSHSDSEKDEDHEKSD